MNHKTKYLFRQIYRQTSSFSTHTLSPLFIYAGGLGFLLIAMAIMDKNEVLEYLYTLVGIMGAVWLFGMVVLNENAFYYKDSVVKMSYIPMYMRILPSIIFQTFVFLMFIVLYSAFTALVIEDWLINIFTLLYYLILGVVLTLPFTMLYLSAKIRKRRTVDVLVFIVLVIAVPILYRPEQLEPWVSSLLSLNPFYYVINGLQTNAVQIPWNINRLPHDILFIVQVIFLYLWMFEYYSKMKINMYQFKIKRPGR